MNYAVVGSDAANGISQALERFVSEIPPTGESAALDPHARAKQLIRSAALRAAAVSGGLALPPGPFGMLTILPDLLAIWRIQAQMVADLAGSFGCHGRLTRAHMLYCLLKHAAGQTVRGLVVRAGERMVARPVTACALQSTLRCVGTSMAQRALRETFGRWVPIIGAVAMSAYAYYDTTKVADAALELFAQKV